MPDYDAELQEAGIRVTAIRSLIWRTLRQHIHNAFTLNDMVDLLVTIDRSTVFRTLTLFSEAKLLHLVDDGMGCQKILRLPMPRYGDAPWTCASDVCGVPEDMVSRYVGNPSCAYSRRLHSAGARICGQGHLCEVPERVGEEE